MYSMIRWISAGLPTPRKVPVSNSVMYRGSTVSRSSTTIDPALRVLGAASRLSSFIWQRKCASSEIKSESSKTSLGTAMAGPGYEHTSLPREPITAFAHGETSKDSTTVSSAYFLKMTAAFWARTKYERTSASIVGSVIVNDIMYITCLLHSLNVIEK